MISEIRNKLLSMRLRKTKLSYQRNASHRNEKKLHFFVSLSNPDIFSSRLVLNLPYI